MSKLIKFDIFKIFFIILSSSKILVVIPIFFVFIKEIKSLSGFTNAKTGNQHEGMREIYLEYYVFCVFYLKLQYRNNIVYINSLSFCFQFAGKKEHYLLNFYQQYGQ